MSRTFQSTGRNSWRSTEGRLCHSDRIRGEIHGMDREPVSAWGVVSTVVWVVGTIYAVSLWMPS